MGLARGQTHAMASHGRVLHWILQGAFLYVAMSPVLEFRKATLVLLGAMVSVWCVSEGFEVLGWVPEGALL